MQAMALASQRHGLRFFCPRRSIEPLVACARQGYADVFEHILAESFFEPFDSAISEAMGEATAHGHLAVARRCWSFGAELEFTYIDNALDNGHTSTVCELMRDGAISIDSPHSDFLGSLDYLFLCCCSRGLESAAKECMSQGACLAGLTANECAKAIAANGMQECAALWIELSPKMPPCIYNSWEKAFPLLMLSCRELIELSVTQPSESAALRSKPRL
jgi:hypothetical protein